MALIGEKVKQEIMEQIEELLTTYLPAMDQAYTKAEKGIVVPFRVKMEPGKKAIGEVHVKTAVAFKLGEVKDKTEGAWVSESQIKVPGM